VRYLYPVPVVLWALSWLFTHAGARTLPAVPDKRDQEHCCPDDAKNDFILGVVELVESNEVPSSQLHGQIRAMSKDATAIPAFFPTFSRMWWVVGRITIKIDKENALTIPFITSSLLMRIKHQTAAKRNRIQIALRLVPGLIIASPRLARISHKILYGDMAGTGVC